MKLPYKKWISAALVTVGLGLIINLVPGILPARITGNVYLIIGCGILIIILLLLLQLSENFNRKATPDSYPFPKAFFCGRQKEQEDIIDLLKNDQISIFTIYGMGGTGKTSLIREVTKENEIFKSVIWQTAKKQFIVEDHLYNKELSESATFENLCKKIADCFGELNEYKALKKEHQRIELIENLLKKHKTLLVIDNFETYDEQANIFIKNLVNLIEGTSSKAVLTSRYIVEDIESYLLKGLSLDAATELLNHELAVESKYINLPEEKIRQIYEATNGLPLAIKLIVARVKKSHLAALDDILKRLSNINFSKPKEVYEQFYKFIYREIWKDLSKDAKQLLIILSTYSIEEQITYNDLRLAFFENKESLSNSEKDKFYRAFAENIKYVLLESKESNNDHWFFIHPLTKTFVTADLLKKT